MSCAPIGCTNRRLVAAAATLAPVPDPNSRRPPGLLVAAIGSLLVGVALIALAAASLGAGHGDFSGGVGIALIVYGVAMVGGSLALWKGSVFGRGPVIAMALLNLVAGYTNTQSAPLVWLIVAVSAATVVGAALPSTSRALHRHRVSSGDEPPQKADPGT
jgi:hypothetical protein